MIGRYRLGTRSKVGLFVRATSSLRGRALNPRRGGLLGALAVRSM